MNLNELRKQLDEIDAQMVALTEQRLQICEQVAQYKIANHRPVLDETREKQKIAAVRELTQDNRYKDAVAHLFKQIMEDSRALQTKILEAEKQKTECDK